MKILYLTPEGASVPNLMNGLKKASKNKHVLLEIQDCDLDKYEIMHRDCDIILIMPRYRDYIDEVRAKTNKPTMTIHPQDFGMLRYDVILDQCLELYKQRKL